MKSFCSLIALVLFASFAAKGQGWERIYSTLNPSKDAEIKKILPVSDGFLLLVPRSSPISFVDNPDFQIMKVNENGGVVWSRTYDFGQEELAQDMIATSDGGYAVLYTVAPSPTSSRSWWVKLNAQFDTVFTRELEYPGIVIDVRAKKITEQNGSIWVFGDKAAADFGAEMCFVRGYDLNGNDLQQNEWGEPGAKFKDMEYLGGGDFVGLSDMSANPASQLKIYLHRYDPTGATLLWEKEFSNPQADFYANDICAAPDGGYLIAGAEYSSGLLIKTDASGNLFWQKVYPPSAPADPDILLGIFKIAPTNDGTGYWGLSGTNSYIPQLVLIRFDLQGNILWTKPFGPYFTYTFGRDLLSMADGGCVIGGSFHQSAQNAIVWPYLVKTNSSGETFSSGVSGRISQDLDDDCIGEVDSVFLGTPIFALKNGSLISLTTAGQQGEYLLPLDTGDYQITMKRPNPAWVFCSSDTISVTVTNGDTLPDIDFVLQYDPQPVDSVFGSVFEDVDGDCVRDSFEIGKPGWTVLSIFYHQGIEHTLSTTTDTNGYFVFYPVGITNAVYGAVVISLPPPNDGLNCSSSCPQSFPLDFQNGNSFQADFGVQCDSLPPCPIIEVDIAAGVLRPCFNSSYSVYYCNLGSVTAENAQVVVSIDSALEVTSSSIPWASVNGNAYTFDLGDLAPEQCGNFSIAVFTPCDEPVGTTYCAEAHAYPDTICAPAGGNWDGSEIEVTAACTGDSVVFTIKNIGTGDMTAPLGYIVIEDNVMLMQLPGQFQLEANDETQIAFEAGGSFFRMVAEQSPGFPGLNIPVAWVEGCGNNGGNISLGFVNQHPLGDDEPWLDVFCLESVNSYDPNDKNGFPRGYDDEHFIEQNVDIEYLVRFQNTGTAPAVNVEIRDTIPVEWLDPATVRPGASSHAYEWDMQGNGVVGFKFADINLPDSNANFDASQGFVKFRVSQRKDVPLGTKIENTAAIFFDFNDPVITNRTLHTVGQNFILINTNTPLPPNLRVKVSPNPAHDQVRVQVEGFEKGGENLTFTLISALGKQVLSGKFTGSNFEFQARQLPEGIYFYEIRRAGKLAATGKLVRM